MGDGRWGTYHIAGEGEASWYDVARETMRLSAALGGPHAEIVPISSRDWETAAPRPGNAALDTSRLAADFGIRLPDWRASLEACVSEIVKAPG